MKKINIHLTVDSRTRKYVESVNRNINAIAPSHIIFTDSSSMIPHITLSMGIIKDGIELDRIIDEVNITSAGIKAQTLKVLPPYLEDYKNNYIFSDVDGIDLSNIRREFNEKISSKYLETQSDYSSKAHLTLGCIETNQEEIRKYLLTVEANFMCISGSIEISTTGSKGTCIDSLYLLKL